MKGDFSRRLRAADLVPHLLLLVLLGWMSITLVADASPEQRQYFLRMWSMVGAAAIAVVTPHVLFPDPHFRHHILMASSAATLLRHQFVRALPLLVHLTLPVAVAMAAGGASVDAAAAFVLLVAVWMLGVCRYVRIGATATDWASGARGGWYGAVHEHLSVPPALPREAMPMLMTTASLFIVGVVGIVGSAALRAGGALMLLPPLVILAIVVAGVGRLSAEADREVFRTQAFFDELFRLYGGVRTDERPAIAFGSVYWAPARLRPAVWALLVQMDRRLPLGRIVAAGHIVFWIMMWSGGYDASVAAYLALFAFAKNMAPAILAGPDASPPSFNLLMQRPPAWVLTRALASVRWTLPWALSLGLVAVLSDAFPLAYVLWWSLADTGLAVGCAFLITLITERRRQHALA